MATPCFLNPLFDVWKPDKTFFLLLNILHPVVIILTFFRVQVIIISYDTIFLQPVIVLFFKLKHCRLNPFST